MKSFLTLTVAACLIFGACCPASVAASPKTREITFVWPNVSTQQLEHTGMYKITITGINDMLYDYSLTVSLNAITPLPSLPGFSVDLPTSAQKAASDTRSMKDHLALASKGIKIVGTCQKLQDDLDKASSESAALNSVISGSTASADLSPSKQSSGGKYNYVPLKRTQAAWDGIALAASGYLNALKALHNDIDNLEPGDNCGTDWQGKLASLDLLAVQLNRLQSRRLPDDPSAHQISVSAYLDRTRGGSITVQEQYQGSDTVQSPVKLPLEAGFSTVTASGGFLLTTLPARSYSSVSEPVMGRANTSSIQTVLGVDGSSRLRPAVAALFNFHDPFEWRLNRPNFGFAISAGPVFDVSNGKADTSKLGFFGGIGVHLWKLLYVTPGVHVGQFSDFPEGFTHAGQVIPTNFGTLAPVQRYSARFGVTITFKGFDLTKVLGGGSSKSTTSSTVSSASQ